MKLYLGNNQDIELDIDDEETINLYPISLARGRIYDDIRKDGYSAETWNGVISTTKNFFYKEKNHKKRDVNFVFKSKEEALLAANKYFEENNKNTINSVIPLQVKNIDERIIKYFRYIQPSIDYPYQEARSILIGSDYG
jgi:hypothetical protein